MGTDPADSVVAPDVAVHGTEGLLVAGSSVFPDTVMHSTNLTCYVLGEVAAQRIMLGRLSGAPPARRTQAAMA